MSIGILGVDGQRTEGDGPHREPDAGSVRTVLRWDGAAFYRPGLLNLALREGLSIKNRFAGEIPSIAVGATKEVKVRDFGDANANLNAVVSIMHHAHLSAWGAPFKVAVVVGDGTALPSHEADVYLAAFANGLAASTLLSTHGVPYADEGEEARYLLTTKAKALEDSLKALNKPEVPKTTEKYLAGLDLLLDEIPIEAYGLYQGWSCGAAIQRNGSEELASAVRSLLMVRFSMREVGLAAAYTLAYLTAFERGREVEAADDNEGIADFEELVRKAIRSLIDGVATAAAAGEHNQLNAMCEVAAGFADGLVVSSRAAFKMTFKLGYGIGYRAGYAVGYSRGYQHGFRKGYKKGKGNFWKDTLQVLQDIRTISGNVAKIVAVVG